MMSSLQRFLPKVKPGRVAMKDLGRLLLTRESEWPELCDEYLRIMERTGKNVAGFVLAPKVLQVLFEVPIYFGTLGDLGISHIFWKALKAQAGGDGKVQIG